MRLGSLIVTLLSVLLLSGPTSLVAQETPYTVRGERPMGNELVMVFLTSYACGPSQRPEVIEAVKVIKRRLAAYADSVDRPFSAVGVSAGWDVAAGIEHLQRYGAFDELITGRSWHNTAAVRYWHRKFPAKPSTPQIVLSEQRVEVVQGEPIKVASTGDTIFGAKVQYGDEELVYRAGSSEAILEWAESGVSIPE